ncbi:MAG: roadblock/LC7 domain-containing protein [Candidatus Helarchaeota archaeon]
MHLNKGDKLNDLLISYGMQSQMRATAIVSRDGFIIASVMDDSYMDNGGKLFDDEIIASMAAEMMVLGERTTEELLKTSPQRVIIDSELGTIVLITAGTEAVIISVIKRNNLGITLFHLQKLAKEVEKTLEFQGKN